MNSTTTDDGFPIRCEVCGNASIVNVSRPPGDSVCPVCGTLLWVAALAEKTNEASFTADLCIPQLSASSLEDAVGEITQAIGEKLNWTRSQQDGFVEAVLSREGLGSTAIGWGFAIPHASVDWINSCCVAIAFTPSGINFSASDFHPVHTIIMIASPAAYPEKHLRLLERVSQWLRWTVQ